MSLKKYYSAVEVAESMGCTRQLVVAAIENGDLIAYKLPGGRVWKISEEAVTDWVEGRGFSVDEEAETAVEVGEVETSDGFPVAWDLDEAGWPFFLNEEEEAVSFDATEDGVPLWETDEGIWIFDETEGLWALI